MLFAPPNLTLLTLVAGLSVANAAPIRVIIASSEIHTITPGAVGGGGELVPSNFRFGHAMGGMSFVGNGVLPKPPPETGVLMGSTKKKHCGGGGGNIGGGGGLKEKMMEITKEFRKALGLDDIVIPEKADEEGWVHIMPVTVPIPEPEPLMDTALEDFETLEVATKAHPHARPEEYYRFEEPTFLERIHASLMALGPWEARAVAFVFGCGIGVLFRMVWVFAVLLFRGGRSDDEAEYTLVVEHVADAERRAVAPPKYESGGAAPAYVIDEKARDQLN